MSTNHQILLVDDEPDILESLAALLDASIDEISVYTAPDGPDALALFADHAFDIVISDYRMPEMNGLEFLGEVRKQHPGCARIMMTAFPDLQLAVEAINDAKVARFFTKPLDPDEVIRVIEETLKELDSRRARDRAFARALDMARKGDGDD